MAGHFAGDIGGAFGGIKRGGVGPDEAKPFADFFICEVGEPDAKGAGVGKRQVSLARLREIGVNLKRMANIHDNEERGVVIGDGADVALGLPARLYHGAIPGIGAAHGLGGLHFRCDARFLGGKFKLGSFGPGFLKLFGFENEMSAPVEVNAAVAGSAVRVMLNDGELEKVAGIGVVVGPGDFEQVAKIQEKRL